MMNIFIYEGTKSADSFLDYCIGSLAFLILSSAKIKSSFWDITLYTSTFKVQTSLQLDSYSQPAVNCQS